MEIHHVDNSSCGVVFSFIGIFHFDDKEKKIIISFALIWTWNTGNHFWPVAALEQRKIN